MFKVWGETMRDFWKCSFFWLSSTVDVVNGESRRPRF